MNKPWAEDLEQRVATLEALASELVTSPSGATRASGVGKPVADPEVFWVLEQLNHRAPPPGAVLIAGAVTLPDGREASWQQTQGVDALLAVPWADTADVLAALGNPVRLKLLHQVLTGVATVQQLTQMDGMGTSGQVYHHLRQLIAAGWLRALGGGRYEVPAERVVPLLTTILGVRR
jgi:DNA-binding transcriptional ArsR family regulator